MDLSEALEDLASSVMSFTMNDNEEEPMTPPSTPAEKSIPEQVLDHRIDEDGNKFYLVKWFGFSTEESTWESENNLNEIAICSTYLLDEFHKKLESEVKEEAQQQPIEPLQTDEAMAVCVDFGNRVKGYEFASSPEEVIGVIDREGDHDFLVKWEGTEKVEIIPRSVANQIWPEMVIKYYEENLVWRQANDEGEQ